MLIFRFWFAILGFIFVVYWPRDGSGFSFLVCLNHGSYFGVEVWFVVFFMTSVSFNWLIIAVKLLIFMGGISKRCGVGL